MLAPSSHPFRALLLAGAFAGIGLMATTPASATSLALATVKPKSSKKAPRLPARPDLVSRGVQLADLDGGVSVRARIANLGNRPARPSAVTIVLSSDEYRDSDDELVGTVLLPRVQRGAERSVAADVEIPYDGADADVFLLVCADGTNKIRERNETNNCVAELVSSSDADATEAEDTPDESTDEATDDEQVDAVSEDEYYAS